MPSRLYVGNLAYTVSSSDLEQLFSQAGQVQSAAVIMDKVSVQSKGFGFVEMANAEDGSKAIQQFNDTELNQGQKYQGQRGQTPRIELRRR
jgi:cold-inducible RNA-binding protein